jgi:hypothetical protein
MESDNTRLHWVDTLGGPHLVLPEACAAAWEGGAAPSAGRVVRASFRCDPSGPATDYDRACSVEGWLGVITVGKGQALVLTGERDSAAYYRTRQGQHFLLRWHYSPSETALLDLFEDCRPKLKTEHEAMFHHDGGRVFLMDSVDRVGKWNTPPSEFVLPRGKYRVITSHCKSDETYLIVHQLHRE